MGRGRRFPVPVLAHAGQVVEALVPGGPAQGTAQPAEGHDHHDAVHVGRKRC